jgi:hypothetical protein
MNYPLLFRRVTDTLTSAMVAATPIPGGAHGGTPAACHESKAMYYEHKGDSAAAAKERQAASEARKGHYKTGGHKRRSAKDEGPMTDMCHEAKAVHLENTGDKAGAKAERAKINQVQFKKEYERADSTAVKNHQKEGWKDTKKGHH